MKKIFVILISFATLSQANAQQNAENNTRKNKRIERQERINAMAKQEEEGIITYKKHFAGGIKIASDGYGAFLEIGRAQSVKKSLLYQFEFSERKHVKEEKQQNIYTGASLIFGKINFFYPVKLGVQQQILLGNKGNKNGVSVTANLGGGAIVGLLRPYMVNVQKPDGSFAYVGYNSPDSNLFLNPADIANGPSLSTGWNKLQVNPGIYIKPAVRFDYGKYNEMISAIEVGVSGEFYAKKVEQIIHNAPKQFFISGYVSLVFGRRK
ncbi:MAG: hypothetical protein JSU03_04070 [Bacteroidetes bacterium]|nr:hypothetical protein [Bacteroidota bacterium]MBS1756431.1 hypothetical protein [Bacteroidota bacterium]